MRYKRKDNKNKYLIIVSICFIFFIGIGYSAYNQNFKISGNATIGQNEQSPIIEITCGTPWQEGGKYVYLCSVTITNNSNEDINGWRVGFDVPEDTELNAAYNSETKIVEGMAYSTPVEYNKVISAGQSITIQIALKMGDSNYNYTNIIFNNGYSESESGGNTGEDVQPTNIILNYTELTMSKGEKKQLTATIEPQEATGVITWESSDTSVVSVSNTGELVAVSSGNAVITAKIGDVSSTCNVTVSDSQASAGDISVSYEIAGSWGSEGAYTRQITFYIQNNTDVQISEWQFFVSAPEGSSIAAIWNSNYEEAENGFIFSGNWLPANSKVDFGVQIVTTDSDYVPEISEIKAYS